MRHLRKKVVYSIANALRRRGFQMNELHNPNVIRMREAIDSLENKAVSFTIEQHPDGYWSAVSTNVDGIMTGGNHPRQIPEFTKDAIFTYFEVPPQFCNDSLLRGDNEPVTVEQRVHVGA